MPEVLFVCLHNAGRSQLAATLLAGYGLGRIAVRSGKRYLDWQVVDHAGQSLEAVRPIRDEIDCRLRGRVTELLDA